MLRQHLERERSMLDIIRDRAKLIAAIVVALAVLFAVRSMGGSGASDPTGQTQVLASRHQAEDAAAQTVLQAASLAMESLFAQSQSYAGGATAAASVEPNVVWVAAGAPASAAANQVAVTSDATSYTLSTSSASGAIYTYSKTAGGLAVKSCGPGCSW